MPITTGSAPQTKGARLYALVVDAVDQLDMADLMAIKRGDDWDELDDDVRRVFENIAKRL